MQTFSTTPTGTIAPIYSAEVIVPTDSLATLCTKPFQLIPNPGENKIIEFLGAVFFYKFNTASMSGGGNIYISYLGFSAISSCISPETLTGEETDKAIQMQLGNTANMIMPPNFGLYLQMTDSDFINKESRSYARVHVMYKIHKVA